MERKIFKLDDSVIAQIVKLLQLGLLTGTDITHHMRQLRLEEGEANSLVLTPEYVSYDKQSIEKMLDEVNKDKDDAN